LGAWGSFGAAALAGSAVGLAFALAWRLAFPPGVQSRFWIVLSVLAQQTLTVDEIDAFLAIYKRLGLALGGYLARNLAVLVAFLAALAAAVLLVLAPVQSGWDRQHGQLRASDAAVQRTAQVRGEEVVYTVQGAPAAVKGRPGVRAAICWSERGCFWPSLLGFELVELKGAPRAGPATVLVRYDDGDINPAYPWLSDLEAVFAGLLFLVMTAGMLWPHKKGAAGPQPILKQSDFALVQINEQFKPLIRALGDLESRTHRAALDARPIEAPIFVCGLARSGTTTVLNALIRTRELASHRYGDFPFLGAPLTWAKVQGAMAGEGTPVERPHKDRILITKTSADAFEEPLWQQFFPQVHDAARIQRLGPDARNPKFEAFFADHLKKILLLRDAGRYVSKGNYNVGRVEYLARLFPDARFVIPVRAPVEHVASLARQHQLFCGYAETDPRVPLYLAAAGHYEFGPQRKPIIYSREAGPALREAFAAGDDVRAYALQWAEVYRHVARLKASGLSDRVLVVRYEDFCADPVAGLAGIIAFCGLADPDGAIAAYAKDISVSEAPVPDAIAARRGEIEALVGEVAASFGYAIQGQEKRSPVSSPRSARITS
jgi:hypothetical protein